MKKSREIANGEERERDGEKVRRENARTERIEE